MGAFFEGAILASGAENDTLEAVFEALNFSSRGCIDAAVLLQKMFANDKEMVVDNLLGVFTDESVTVAKNLIMLMENRELFPFAPVNRFFNFIIV